ncbi:MAG: hypothetical protein BAJALOKI2v1_530011 [Promethearchaeota archaeon]|nr:MAG: hypothetical protein BAJALOKI2v1_530011 [Candidatus Lokiarchaeota archaeon]
MKKFIDFDKNEKVFFDNFYLDDEKLVIKIPLSAVEENPKEDLKIEHFNLAKYVYLTAY